MKHRDSPMMREEQFKPILLNIAHPLHNADLGGLGQPEQACVILPVQVMTESTQELSVIADTLFVEEVVGEE